MKKTLLALAILTSTFAAYAQDGKEPLIDRSLISDFLNLCGIVLVVYLISAFILQLFRQNLDYRLKSKIIEKGTPENIVGQLMQPDKKDSRNVTLQWLCTLSGIGLGFILMIVTRPIGLHSFAIMAFCVVGGLGAYYFFTRPNKN
jgi:FtsH-binding integral membrane protein